MESESRELEIWENTDAGEVFDHQNRSNFFAVANFIVSRRRGSQFKSLVEWLHRREIASARAIAHTNALVQSVISRPLGNILVTINNENHKSLQIMQLQYV